MTAEAGSKVTGADKFDCAREVLARGLHSLTALTVNLLKLGEKSANTQRQDPRTELGVPCRESFSWSGYLPTSH